MKCPKCGRFNEEDSVFCEYCGHKLKKVKWPIVLVACLLVVGVCGVYFIKKENDRKKTAESEEQQFYEHCRNVMDYRKYKDLYPDGKFVDLANSQIKQHVDDSIQNALESQAREEVVYYSCTNTNACRTYLKQYPLGKHVNSVQIMLEGFIQDSLSNLYDENDFSEERVKETIVMLCNANVSNDFETIGKLFASQVKRYHGIYSVTRDEVVTRYRNYDSKFSVYDKHSSVRWNTFEAEKIGNEISVIYVEDYSIDRKDKSKYSKFVLEKHLLLNVDYEIISIYDVEISKSR